MPLSDADLYRFWAKTSDDGTRYFHPLICHMADVAVVASAMWREGLPNRVRQRASHPFNADGSQQQIAFIAGIHDLGKCSPPFALRGHNEPGLKTADLLALFRGSEFWRQSVPPARLAPHGHISAAETPRILAKMGCPRPLARQTGLAIGAHHGVFPDSTDELSAASARYAGGRVWADARTRLAETLANLLDVGDFAAPEAASLDNASLMILAGLVSVADWIGSDTRYFPCAAVIGGDGTPRLLHNSLENYIRFAEGQAMTALRDLGWLLPPARRGSSRPYEETPTAGFERLFPQITEKRPLQLAAIELARETELGGIVVVEAPTGEGKTETALYLGNTFNDALGQDGFYFALPTQATSNQMFGRFADFLRRAMPGRVSNLQLMHSHASLSAEFAEMREDFGRLAGIFDEDRESEDNSCCCAPAVVAAEWFTYRKRALLAPFGVGTIDQALMAVLRTRHAFVRLFGLAGKTVIVDEVHAYDAYMSRLLERLLEWLGALGAPVVLLSATLPKARRNRLVAAYLKGAAGEEGEQPAPAIPDAPYPRITFAAPGGRSPIVKHVEASAKSRRIALRFVGPTFAEELRERLDGQGGGGCAAVICNTVARAQRLTIELIAAGFVEGEEIDLLHSRFPFAERDERERRCLERFGPPRDSGDRRRRRRFVLVSTQIIEQSLDVDFDLVVTDLAPADLLIQRAGRLHRHDRPRPAALSEPELWIVSPPETGTDGLPLANHLGLPDFGESGAVYDPHILLRTWLALRRREFLDVPGDVEELVEWVYGDDAADTGAIETGGRLGEMWDASRTAMRRALAAEEAQAVYNYIASPDYRLHPSGIMNRTALSEDSANPAATRLSDASVDVVCLWSDARGRLFLDREGGREEIKVDLAARPSPELTREFLMRSVPVSSKSVANALLAEMPPAGWRGSALLSRHRVLAFERSGGRCVREFGSRALRLDDRLGLIIEKKE